MPTRTPAEKERIRKKHEKESRIGTILFIVFVVAFVIICEKTTLIQSLFGKLDVQPEPTELDKRIEYALKLGTDYTAADDAVRLALNDGNGGTDQVIITASGGMLSVSCKTIFEFLPLPSDYSPIFSGVEEPPEKKYDEQALEETCARAAGYLIHLFGDDGGEELASKLCSAASEVLSDEKHADRQFMFGVYTIKVEYEASASLLTFTAAPAK